MPGFGDPTQIANAKTRSLQKEIEYWKTLANERLLDFFKSVKPQPDDFLIFRIPVGSMPTHEISNYITDISGSLNDKRTDAGFMNLETFYLPFRSDGVGPTMDLLSPKEGDILIVSIPVGNLPASQIDEYIADIRKALPSVEHSKLSHVLWLPTRDGRGTSLELVSEKVMEDQGWVRK